MCRKIVALMFILAIICSPITISRVMADGKTPKMLKKFATFHENECAKMLNEKKYSSESDVHVIEDFLKELIAENNFSMSVKIDKMDQIIKNDKIQSNVEKNWNLMKDLTKDNSFTYRKFLSIEMFGADESEIGASDYEKYGYLSSKDESQDIKDLSSFRKYYGNVIINLKKENLLDRTTLSIGNSLNLRNSIKKELSVIPTWVKNPRVVCIPDWSSSCMENFSNAIKDKNLVASRPNLLCHQKNLGFNLEYFELQFHGDLSFTQDVESVVIVRRKGYNEEEQKFQEQLKELNIPCRVYDEPEFSTEDNVDCASMQMNQVFKTKNGNIIVKAPAGVFPEGSELYCRLVDKDENDYNEILSKVDNDVRTMAEKLRLFDISMVDKYGNEIKAFDKKVTLYLQIPKGYNKKDIEIVHVNDGKDENFDEWVESIDGTDYVVANVNYFDSYAIIDEWGKADYWWMYGISLAVLAVGIGSFVYIRKKVSKSLKSIVDKHVEE